MNIKTSSARAVAAGTSIMKKSMRIIMSMKRAPAAAGTSSITITHTKAAPAAANMRIITMMNAAAAVAMITAIWRPMTEKR